MSDYSQIVNFTAKDALSTGDADKLILGTQFDAELGAISTAIATKLDPTDIATTGEAQALSSNSKVITPSGLNDVLTANGKVISQLQAFADPGADGIFGWDDSASAGAEVIAFTMGDGLEFSGTTIQLPASIAGVGITKTAGVLSLSALSSTTTNPVAIASGVPNLELATLTSVEGSSLAATSTLLADVGGVTKGIHVQSMGLRVQTAQTSQTLGAADMNSIMQFAGTATLTLPNSLLSLGAPVILQMTHATQILTVDLAASAELESVNHPGSAASVTDTVNAGGTALLYQTASGKWKLTGDITD